MSSSMVMLSYFAAMILAVFLLWRFSHVAWYWHVLALAVALGVGLMPPLTTQGGRLYDMAVGCVFVFLFVWGLGGPIVKLLHLPHHA